ncbi:MAG: hypothetical protein LBM98_06435 [Oscillospiraceae bacterium]|nr:hypothetical protein [Oscillospiraceae bacterium]
MRYVLVLPARQSCAGSLPYLIGGLRNCIAARLDALRIASAAALAMTNSLVAVVPLSRRRTL